MVLQNIVRTFTAECKFYFDEQARDQIFELIRDAKEWLDLVSPYNKHPQQLRVRLTEAIERGVRVTMLYREDKDQREAVTYLKDLGATVLPVKWLHSKIYMNESRALASSMNLLESSFNNSSEFCIRIDRAHTNNGRLYNELDNYVQRIRQRAERRSPSATPGKRTPAKATAPKSTRAKAAAKSVPPRRRAPKAAVASETGRCRHCGRRIPLNPEKPLCLTCWRSGVRA